MQIFVYKNGQQLGPYSEADVKNQLATGILTPQDMIWWEGQAGWAPIAQTTLALELTGAAAVPPGAAPVVPGATPPTKKNNGLIIGLVIGCGGLAVLAFIVIVAISVLLALGQTVRGVFSTINSQLALEQTNDASDTTTNTPDTTNPPATNTAPDTTTNAPATNAAPGTTTTAPATTTTTPSATNAPTTNTPPASGQ